MPLPAYSWNPPAVVNPFRAEDSRVLCLDDASGQPLAVVKALGRGRVLFFGTPLDPLTPFGISRFPYFPYYLKNVLQISFPVRRANLEFYFDPGLRQNVSWERLVRRWRASAKPSPVASSPPLGRGDSGANRRNRADCSFTGTPGPRSNTRSCARASEANASETNWVVNS